MKKRQKQVRINDIKVGADAPFFLIAGPCVIESEESLMRHAEELKRIQEEVDIPLIFKSSYDKANRTSVNSFRGVGIKEGLKLLSKVKKKYSLPVLSDVHTESQVEMAKDILDVIQIPALLSRQTDLIIEVAKTMKPINVKKGQFLSPYDIKYVIEKINSVGNDQILLTERGYMFGYNNLVSDMRSIPIMKDYGYPVVFDASHSVQMPGGLGKKSAGERRYIPYLAKAAVAAGCDGVFIEVHQEPDKALCDGPNMLKLKDLKKLLFQLKQINQIVKKDKR